MPDTWAVNRLSGEAIARNLGFDRATTTGLANSALTLRRVWQTLLRSQSPGGVTYTQELRTIRGPGRTRVVPVGPRPAHTAAAPGYPPNTDDGDLLRSIKVRIIDAKTHVQVYSDDIAAAAMEFGVAGGGLADLDSSRFGPILSLPGFLGPHPGGIKILPRPSARPAMAIVLPGLKQGIRLDMKSSLRHGRSVNILQLARSGIIGFSSFVGDIQAFGIRVPGLQRLRSSTLRLGRGLGDLNALSRGTIDQRIVRRIVGRGERRLVNQMTVGFGQFGGRVARKSLAGPAAELLNQIKFR